MEKISPVWRFTGDWQLSYRYYLDGNELWFPLMVRYIEASPYAKEHSLHGMEGLLAHLERRKALEHRIINEIFQEETIIAKNYTFTIMNR